MVHHMSSRARITAFAVVLAVVFAGGWGLGAAVGPLDEPEPAEHGTEQPAAPAASHTGGHP
jgi:hypothetical protein